MNEIEILNLIKANNVEVIAELVSKGTNLNFYNTTWETSPIIQAISIMSKDMVKIILEAGGGMPEYDLGRCLERLIIKQLPYHFERVEDGVEICRMLIRHDLNELGKIEGHYLGMRYLADPDGLPLLRELLKWGIGIEQINLVHFLVYDNQCQPNFIEHLMTILAAGVGLGGLEFMRSNALRFLYFPKSKSLFSHYELRPRTYWVFMLAGFDTKHDLATDLKYLKTQVPIEVMEDLSVEYQKIRANYQWNRFRTARITTIFQVCVGLAPLELSANEQISILNESFPEYAILENSYSYFWNVVTTIKHFHKKK